ncbi:MAG: hypothetical protein E7160_04930 [Firmicutes bacterium]|nr:hypothetical protein [Bacillota bacterium]
MAKIINIVNGVGTGELINDTYTVTADVVGYDNTTIDPSSVTVDATTNTYSFTIAATGTLTLHVTEDGTSTGTPIVGATFIRTDSTGTEYGSLITTDTNGDAVFNNVPYATTGAPIIYYKQTASDGSHEFDSTVQNITMTTQTSTVEIQNIVGATRTINLTDANYDNLVIDTATLTFTN